MNGPQDEESLANAERGAETVRYERAERLEQIFKEGVRACFGRTGMLSADAGNPQIVNINQHREGDAYSCSVSVADRNRGDLYHLRILRDSLHAFQKRREESGLSDVRVDDLPRGFVLHADNERAYVAALEACGIAPPLDNVTLEPLPPPSPALEAPQPEETAQPVAPQSYFERHGERLRAFARTHSSPGKADGWER